MQAKKKNNFDARTINRDGKEKKKTKNSKIFQSHRVKQSFGIEINGWFQWINEQTNMEIAIPKWETAVDAIKIKFIELNGFVLVRDCCVT